MSKHFQPHIILGGKERIMMITMMTKMMVDGVGVYLENPINHLSEILES